MSRRGMHIGYWWESQKERRLLGSSRCRWVGNIVAQCLKVGIVESQETSIARQLLGKQVSAATDTQTTIEELLETVFFV
jgi:hypothetical protein